MLVYGEKHSQQQDLPKGQSGAQFTPRVLLRYYNTHEETDSKTLKRLFELIAPVSFVDHQNSIVRYKTAKGAELALGYFNSHCIIQKNVDDFALQVSEAHAHRQAVKKSIPPTDGIYVRLLQGIFINLEQQEKQYWSTFISSLEDNESMLNNHIAFGQVHHVKFGDDEDNQQAKKHVKFGDDEDNQQAKKHIKFGDDEDNQQAKKHIKFVNDEDNQQAKKHIKFGNEKMNDDVEQGKHIKLDQQEKKDESNSISKNENTKRHIVFSDSEESGPESPQLIHLESPAKRSKKRFKEGE